MNSRIFFTSRRFLLCVLAITLVFAMGATIRYAYATGTVVVTPTSTDWWFFQETPTGSATFVYGPLIPTLGGGSAQFTVDGTGGEIFGTFAYAGTRLDAITSLGYSTYRVSGSSALAPSLQLDIDTDVTDANTAWQGRLVYEPYYTHTVSTGIWQTWNPLDNAATGNWWFTGAPGNAVCPINHACTWAQVLAAFPNAGIRSAGVNTGALQFKAGGGWTGGFVGNVDAFSIGVNHVVTTYDFELPFTVPSISSMAPSSKLTSDAAFTLTVNGSNFFPSSIVQWNGSNRITTFSSSTQLTAAISSSDLPIANTFPVTVTNPTPGGGISNAQVFTVLAVPGTLHVITQVVNNNAGTATSSLFNLHIMLSGADIAGSPASGTSTPGTSYTLPAGTYTVSEDATSSYTQSLSGDCDASGSITLAPGDDKTCTMTNTDIPPPPPIAPAAPVSSGSRENGPIVGSLSQTAANPSTTPGPLGAGSSASGVVPGFPSTGSVTTTPATAISVQKKSPVLVIKDTNIVEKVLSTTKANAPAPSAPIAASSTQPEQHNLFDVNIQAVSSKSSFPFVFAGALAIAVAGVTVLLLEHRRIIRRLRALLMGRMQ